MKSENETIDRYYSQNEVYHLVFNQDFDECHTLQAPIYPPKINRFVQSQEEEDSAVYHGNGPIGDINTPLGIIDIGVELATHQKAMPNP